MVDPEEIAHQKRLLQIHRSNLAHHLKQLALLGGEAYAPPAITNGLREERANIRRIKDILNRWGEPVADHVDDEAAGVGSASPAAPAQPAVAEPAQAKPARKRKPSGGPDVYVSYGKADRAWVRDELLPLLEGAGLSAIVDWRDFAIGLPKIVNMERAVADTRHTIVVITPEWLNDDWNAFQGILAASENPSGLEQKLIPIILKPARLPSRLSFLEPADLTDPAERRQQLDRLVRSIADTRRRAQPKSPPKQTEPAPPTTPASPVEQRAPSSSEASPARVDFVIVTALDEEREAVLKKLPGYRRHDPSSADIRVYYSADVPVTTASGTKGSYRVVVLSLLGMGRVQAATATADAIRQWRPRYVMLVGIAGGVASAGVKIGDVVISDQIADYELQKIVSTGPEIRWQIHRVDPRLIGAVQNYTTKSWQDLIDVERPDDRAPKRHIGTIVTGDKVIAVDDLLAKYTAMWPKLVGVEMEAGGAAAAAFQTADQVGFFMVRGVSDLADSKKASSRVKNWRAYACDVAAAYAIALLRSGPVPLASSAGATP